MSRSPDRYRQRNPVSAQRFIRCKHCGLPHEAEATQCPVTGEALEPSQRRRSVKPPPPSPVNYEWAHSVHPLSEPLESYEVQDASKLVGRTIEKKYRIEEMIGRGGMGAVFRAINTRIGKSVAIKVLLRGYEKGSESERRFRREARVAGSLGHPNIVEVFDLGHLDDGAPFQVMELLEGQTLADRIRIEGALPVDEVLDVAEEVLSALEAAHDRGIVHRDLKPDNVFLLERQGVVTAKLLDFGVSKSLTGDQTMSLTQTGMVVGTPYYLAPEQARGDRDIDHLVDLWAMGVVLYEGLTGTLPYRADNYNALLAKILSTRPTSLAKIRPQIDPRVAEIVETAMAHERRDRYESADEMLRELRAARGKSHVSSEMKLPSRRVTAPASIAGQDSRAVGRQTLAELSIEDELRASSIHGGDDPTEISDSFRYSETDRKR